MLQTVPDLKSDIPARDPQDGAGQGAALLLNMDGAAAGQDAKPRRDGFAGEISAARVLADRRLWRISLVIAVALHGALFYALVSPDTRIIGGAGGRELDAISVTLISSEVLEALNPNVTLAASGGARAALRQGGPASKAPSASSPANKASAKKPPPVKSKVKAKAKPEDKPKPQETPRKQDRRQKNQTQLTQGGKVKKTPEPLQAKSQPVLVEPVPAESVPVEPGQEKPEVHEVATKPKSNADKVAAKKAPRAVVSDQPPVLTTVQAAELKTSITSAIEPDRKTTAQKKRITRARHSAQDLSEKRQPEPTPENQPAPTLQLEPTPDKRLAEVAALKPPVRRKPEPKADPKQKNSPSPARQTAAAIAASVPKSGGATSRTRNSRARQASGPAAATPGEKNSFAYSVVKSLRRGIPPIRHRRGRKRTVIVRFALDSSGSVRYVKVAKSSGRKRLDRAIIKAVEEVEFPRPPKSMTLNDLIYRMPFHFN